MPNIYTRLMALLLLFVQSSIAIAEDAESAEDIAEITVKAVRVANEQPASTYASIATALRFDPLTEIQSRGLAEGQSDVTVRGGLFENTGFKLGAVTIADPQTGHYVAELPVDPALLTTPAVLQGIDSAVSGFNASIATVDYGFNAITDSGYVGLGAGSDSLNYQLLRFGRAMSTSARQTLGFVVSAARSEGDGTVEFGDHEFSRFNVQLQRQIDGAQTDLLFSYQDKFYGWPGAYTGFATLPEIDDTQTTLVLLNHRVERDNGWFEAGGFYRRLEDDYDFNRTNFETGVPGSFEHETRVIGAGFQGLHSAGRISWRYGGQLTKDELVFSTDLTNGPFDERTYLSLSVVPEISMELDSGATLVWRFGAGYDHTDQDGDRISPLLGVALQRGSATANTTWSLEFSEATQVPGYTALKSNPTGLFGGNAALGREVASQLVASYERDTTDTQMRLAVFVREDDDLVDWTFATGAPFARQANAVDIDVLGFEAFYVRRLRDLDIALGYTAIDKDPDYGTAVVDASYYALNFARHRVTLALGWRITDSLELRLDNEYRVQEDNPLRTGDDNAFLASASLSWRPAALDGFELAVVADNVTDSEYQPFPGTPASGRQVSLGASYRW